MKVLVTGGAGFLGRYIVGLCQQRGWAVVSFQRSDAPDLRARGVEVVRGDLAEANDVLKAATGCDAVFHVAAIAGVWGPQASYERINVTGTANVLAACQAQGITRLVYTSTPSVVFSGAAFAGADESLPYGRNWLCHYAETKARAEQMVLAAHDPEGLRVCALRPHLIWGVGDPHLVPRVVDRARRGRLRIVGTGQNRVDLTHVRNAAEAHLQALDALVTGTTGGKAYFLSDGAPVALWPWINDLLQRLGLPPVTKRISPTAAYRLGGGLEWAWATFGLKGEPPMTRFVATELAKDHWFDISAGRRDFGYTPEHHCPADGLNEVVEAMKQLQ